MNERCDVCHRLYCRTLLGDDPHDFEQRARCWKIGYERLQDELAAAEERGRRAGIEAHIRDLHAIENALNEFEADPIVALRVVGEHVGMALHNLRDLAPRDSGKEG